MGRLLCVVGLALVTVGCASVYIDTEADSAYSLSRSAAVYVDLGPDPSVAAKNFHRLLLAELRHAGVNVADAPKDAALVLLHLLNDVVSAADSSLVFPVTSVTTGEVGGTSFSATTVGPQRDRIDNSVGVRRIYLTVFRLDPDGKLLDRVWEGYLGADPGSYSSAPKGIIRRLVAQYGKTFHGYVTAPFPE